ncbi:acyltransferase family protein [Methylobacterium aquaticum]|uniref:acyltransferase family protein n=1 Tax=Methylobacterium aquaticum TaxID=270351 RepID=UPI001FEE7091|nr:acyltransferase [Methylobacterium aquaticum]
MTGPPVTRPTLLPPIQVLRALAAVMVAAGHAQFEVAGLAARAGLAFTPAAWLPWPAGVDVFFVISGFIIVHASSPLHGRADARRTFLAHRIARVVPLYWLATTVVLALAWARPGLLGTGAEGPGYLAASYLFWPMARADGAVQPLYSLGWTLNYEMAFYVVFALVLPLGRRAAVLGVLALLAGLVVIGRVAGPLPVALAFWSDPIVLEFACGAGLGLARQEGLRLPGLARLVLAVAGLALLSLAGETPALPAASPGAGLPCSSSRRRRSGRQARRGAGSARPSCSGTRPTRSISLIPSSYGACASSPRRAASPARSGPARWSSRCWFSRASRRSCCIAPSNAPSLAPREPCSNRHAHRDRRRIKR